MNRKKSNISDSDKCYSEKLKSLICVQTYVCVCTIFNKVDKEAFSENLTLEKSHKKYGEDHCREREKEAQRL